MRLDHFRKLPEIKLDNAHYDYTHICMGSRNISISDDAYMRLRRMRMHPRESFSQVIRRAEWDHSGTTARSWLKDMEAVPELSDAILETLEANQKADMPPEDKWSC